MNPAKTGEQGKVQGEGDYEAGRRYRERTEKFVGSGQVEPAARRAEPGSAAEAADLRDAERAGKAPARPGSEDSEKKQPDDPHVSRR